MENIFYINSNEERAGVVILISDKINLKYKKVQEKKKVLYINKSFSMTI